MARRRRDPVRPALGQQLRSLIGGQASIVHAYQFQTSIRHVDLDQIAILDQRDGTAIERLRRHVANRRTFGRARETPIGHDCRRMR